MFQSFNAIFERVKGTVLFFQPLVFLFQCLDLFILFDHVKRQLLDLLQQTRLVRSEIEPLVLHLRGGRDIRKVVICLDVFFELFQRRQAIAGGKHEVGAGRVDDDLVGAGGTVDIEEIGRIGLTGLADQEIAAIEIAGSLRTENGPDLI